MGINAENLALSSNGTVISSATSSHPRFTSENILDGKIKTFWLTTGLFPQEFVVSFSTPIVLKKAILSSSRVAEWTVEKSSQEVPLTFEPLHDQVFEDTEFQIQTLSVAPADSPVIQHLRFELTKGHGPFAAVHRLVVYGDRVAVAAKESLPDALESDFN